MTDPEYPVCDCPEPCACYAEGPRRRQRQGLLRGPGQPGGSSPCRRVRLPALPGEEGLPPEGDDADGQEFARALRAGGGLGAGKPRRPALQLLDDLQSPHSNHRAAAPADSPQVYLATMSLLNHRPCPMIAEFETLAPATAPGRGGWKQALFPATGCKSPLS